MGSEGRRWWVLFALSLGPAVSNSFARFAYALLLPAMRGDLHWTYAQAGGMNTANAAPDIAAADQSAAPAAATIAAGEE